MAKTLKTGRKPGSGCSPRIPGKPKDKCFKVLYLYSDKEQVPRSIILTKHYSIKSVATAIYMAKNGKGPIERGNWIMNCLNRGETIKYKELELLDINTSLKDAREIKNKYIEQYKDTLVKCNNYTFNGSYKSKGIAILKKILPEVEKIHKENPKLDVVEISNLLGIKYDVTQRAMVRLGYNKKSRLKQDIEEIKTLNSTDVKFIKEKTGFGESKIRKILFYINGIDF